MKYRKARLQDVDAIMSLVQQRIDWMNETGLHQWNETDYFGRYPRKYWEDNIYYFLVGEAEDGRIVAAIALYDNDVRWTRDGKLNDSIVPVAERAYYLHHLVTDTGSRGVGREMLRYVERYAQQNGISLLRLDSAVGNTNLEYYYTEMGYSACGTCHDRLYHGILRQKRLN